MNHYNFSALVTPRLVLQPLRLADSDAVQKLFPQWEVVRFLAVGVPWPYPADGALIYIRDKVIPAIQQGQAWHWSLRLKTAPDLLIGVASLIDGKDNNNRGFWLDPVWQGQGLMTEASHEITRYWFEVLGKPVLRVPKAVANAPSRRISEKSGMRVILTEERDYVSGRHLTEVWEITAEEWRAQNGSPVKPPPPPHLDIARRKA